MINLGNERLSCERGKAMLYIGTTLVSLLSGQWIPEKLTKNLFPTLFPR